MYCTAGDGVGVASNATNGLDGSQLGISEGGPSVANIVRGK